MDTIILIVHIIGGIVAIPAGFGALFLRKGSPLHKAVGNLFSFSMLTMAIGASYLGYIHDDINDIISGFMTIYFVTTAWVAVKRRNGKIGIFEKIAFFAALTGFSATFYFANGPANYISAFIIGYAAVLDLNLILRGGLSGKHRIARHLWRMCLALFIAVGSFFLGQMQIFPMAIRKIEILTLPVIAVIVLMIFWLTRVLLPKLFFKSSAEQ